MMYSLFLRFYSSVYHILNARAEFLAKPQDMAYGIIQHIEPCAVVLAAYRKAYLAAYSLLRRNMLPCEA